MRLVIAGSHKFASKAEEDFFREAITNYVRQLPNDVTVITGGADGVDTFAYDAAMERWKKGTLPKPIVKVADWYNLKVPGAVIRVNRKGRKYNAAAGPMRNREMLKLGDALTAWHHGRGNGTNDILTAAQSRQFQLPWLSMRLVTIGEWQLEATEDPAAFFIREPGQ